jgi:hypothetical protein
MNLSICVHVCEHVNTHTHTHTLALTRTHSHAHTHTHAHTRTRAHTHAQTTDHVAVTATRYLVRCLTAADFQLPGACTYITNVRVCIFQLPRSCTYIMCARMYMNILIHTYTDRVARTGTSSDFRQLQTNEDYQMLLKMVTDMLKQKEILFTPRFDAYTSSKCVCVYVCVQLQTNEDYQMLLKMVTDMLKQKEILFA